MSVYLHRQVCVYGYVYVCIYLCGLLGIYTTTMMTKTAVATPTAAAAAVASTITMAMLPTIRATAVNVQQ